MTPPPAAPQHNTLLAAELIGRIRGHGPLPVSGFMARCLYDPLLGYYSRGLNFLDDHGHEVPLGRDFTTAPCLTPLFGATLAHWVYTQWQKLGSPATFSLVEAGPGNAALFLPLLLQLQATFPTCFRAATTQPGSLHLVESSPALTILQQHKLKPYSVQWHTTLATLPHNQPTILIANELLDAFPTASHTFINNAWYQHVVSLSEDNTLTLSTKPARHPPPYPPQFTSGWQPTEGTIIESSPTQTHWLHTLRDHLAHTHGAALLLDYGYTNLPENPTSTLQALYRHQPVSLLHRPGETDLTAHVNFSATATALNPAPGGQTTIIDLAPFLLSHGLLALAESSIHTPCTTSALHRLLHPTQMASRFKALEFTA